MTMHSVSKLEDGRKRLSRHRFSSLPFCFDNLSFEEHVTAPAHRLRPVQRLVDICHEFFGVDTMIGSNRYANARPDL